MAKDLNEAMLEDMGSSHHDPLSLPEDWFNSGSARAFGDRIHSFLRQEFEHSQLFVIKDPRLSIVLPVWIEALRRFDAQISCVLPIRNPLEVAQSLLVRNGWSINKGLALWLKYVVDGERHSRNLDRSFVFYHELLEDWPSVARRVSAELDLVWPQVGLRTKAEINRFLSRDLRHHIVREQDFSANPEISEWVLAAFEALRHVREDEAGAIKALDKIRQDWLRAEKGFGPLLVDLELAHARDVEGFQGEIGRLAGDLSKASDDVLARSREIEGLTNELNARDDEIRRAGDEVLARSREIVGLTNELKARDDEIRRAGDDVLARSREIEGLTNELKVREEKLKRSSGELELCVGALRASQERISHLSIKVRSWQRQVDDLEITVSSLQALTSSWSASLFHLLKLRLERSGGVGLEAKCLTVALRAINLLRRRRVRRLILRSEMFDVDFYLRSYPDVAEARIDPLNHYIIHGAAEGRNPNPVFDTVAYLHQNPDVAASNLNPLAHYLVHGKVEGRLPKRGTSDASPGLVLEAQPLMQPHSGVDVERPVGLVDGAAGDATGWDTLIALGAVSLWRQSPANRSRNSVWTSGRPKIIFVSHEASRTGAPLILLALIASFARTKSYELLIICLKSGPLLEMFAQHGHVLDASRHNLFSGIMPTLGSLIKEISDELPILAICNTANVNGYAQVLKSFGIPVMTLVHEMAEPYPEAYFRQIYETSDAVVFPARFVQEAAHKKAPLPEGKSTVIPQGLLNPDFGRGNRNEARRLVRHELGIPEDSFLVLACGYISLRKGTDLFVSTAQAVERRSAESNSFRVAGFGSN